MAAVHAKRVRTDSSTTVPGPPSSSICRIPKDIYVSLLLFLDVADLWVHLSVSKYSNRSVWSSFKLIKTASIDLDRTYSRGLIEAVGQRCTRLSYLTLRNHNSDVDDSVWAALRHALSRVPTVCAAVSSRYLHNQICHVLKERNIRVEEIYAEQFDGRHWAGWAHFSSTLKRLDFSGVLGSQSTISKCHNLEALTCDYRRNNDLVGLAKCPNFRSLSLHFTGDYQLPYFPAITEFRGFNCRNLYTITRSMPNLRILYLPACYMTVEDELECLGSLKRLKVLHIDNMSGGFATLVRSCAHLEVLVMTFLEWSAYNLVNAFKQITVEDVNVCSWKWLRLTGMRVGDDDLIDIARKLAVIAPRLVNVSINSENVKGSGGPKLHGVGQWVRDDVEWLGTKTLTSC